MKTLIIGGSGLISTAITRQLVDRGEDLILYNRGRTPLRVDGDIAVVRGDRTDATRFEEQLAALGPLDCVIDMVCFDPAEAASAWPHGEDSSQRSKVEEGNGRLI